MSDVRAELHLRPGLRLATRRPGPHRRSWIIRPDDLVVLDVATVNLRVVPGEGDDDATLVRDGPGTAYLILTLPPQHLTEVAYFTTVEGYPVEKPGDDKPEAKDPDTSTGDEDLDDPPIDARLAGWSTLSFIVRDEHLPITWTLEGLFAKIPELELSVAPNALPPRPPQRRLDPSFEIAVQGAAFGGLGLIESLLGAAGGTGAPATGPAEANGSLSSVSRVVAASGGEPAERAAAVLGARRASLRGLARDRRTARTIGHVLGLSEVTGSATSAFLEPELIGGVEIAPLLARPSPRPPTERETGIELPHRLILSPNRHGRWFQRETAGTSVETGHTELWHTRLGVLRPDGRFVDGADPLRTLRAIWTTQLPPPTTPDPGDDVTVPKHSDTDPFRTSLDRFDRHNVVHLTSNFQLREWNNAKRFFEPSPLDVELLALSSLGGWLDSRGVWDDQPLGLSVEEWRHRATLGRDHYVRVVYAGRLFPLGHRASLVKISERRFEEAKPGHPAYLRQRMFLIVREPVRTYRGSGLVYDGPEPARENERWDLKIPFAAARIMTVVSPLLDQPKSGEVAPGLLQSAFWPYVGGEPFRFHVIATDVAGQPVELQMPLIFVGQEEGDRQVTDPSDPLTSIVPTSVRTEYESRTWPQGPQAGQLLSKVPLGGQKVAFAPSAEPDDTSFAVDSLTFGGEVPAKATYNKLNRRQPRYVPVVRATALSIPAIQQLAQTDQPAELVYHAAYLEHGFGPGNAGEVFLAAPKTAAKLGIAFSARADRSGGFVAPDMALSGLSRITGPVSGAVDLATAGSFDPTAWFGAITDARLFGALKLSDILDVTPFSALDALPRFVGDSLDQVGRVVADLERLERLLATAGSIPAAADVSTQLAELVDPDTGALAKLVKDPTTLPDAIDRLTTLANDLAGLPAALEAAGLGSGLRAVVGEAAESLTKTIPGALGLLGAFAGGDLLPESFAARFDWRPVLRPTSIFKPNGLRNLILSVEAVGDEMVVTCSLDDFVLDLEVLILAFERVQFRARAGRKPEIDVAFTGFTFAGPLSFIEVLRELIPFDGFSDPPEVDVTPEGITAGFSTSLPNIAVGVFSLENLSLAAGFSVPFVGPPMTTWFRFCERENPARLTVSLFGGGFFFGITVDASGLQVVEGAFEFGAAISVNFGVASGSVSAMAGLYFKIEGSAITLAGYFRLRGEVEALGIVSVSIELYLEMRYEDGGGKSGKCVGTATISIEIEVALFSATIKITATKKFAGSGEGGDPTLAETLNITPAVTSTDWDEYWGAFAA